MEKTKKYQIDNFEKLLNVVNKDNVGNLSIDIYNYLRAYIHVIEKIREERPEVSNGKTNWELCPSDFIWIDDGKTDFKGFNVTIKDTGEQVFIKSKNK